MSKQNISTLIGITAVVFATTVIAEYIYLQHKFTADETSGKSEANEITKTSDADNKKLSELRKINTAARLETMAKDRRIAELESKLRKSAKFTQAALSIADDDESIGGQQNHSSQSVSLAYSTRNQMGDVLEDFVNKFASFIEDEGMDEYEKDFGDFIASLKEDQSPETVQLRKESMLASLQAKLDSTTSDRQKAQLTERINAITNASDENVASVLNYYQKLDDIKKLNHLMDKYSISRDELRDSGIEPPPRSKWGPDVLEVAYNLDSFAELYKPLVASEQQVEFEEDFSNYIDDITRRLTDQEALYQKNVMMETMQDSYETASDREKKRLERKMAGLEKSSLNSVRKWIQYDNLKEINVLAEKYDIPYNDLKEVGVMTPWGRHSRRH